MLAKHVLYLRTLSRALQTGIENINVLIKNLSRLIRKSLGSFMQVSTVFMYQMTMLDESSKAFD